MAKRGRPRSFNRDEALLQALELFWRSGYEGTTLMDLQAAMGQITAPSFYAAFGSKEALFREAVDLYARTQGGPIVEALWQSARARTGVENMLRAAVASFTQPDHPPGCLIVCSINCLVDQPALREDLRAMRLRTCTIFQERFARAQSEGDLGREVDCAALASFYATVLQGLAIQARDGASQQALLQTVDIAMRAWPADE